MRAEFRREALADEPGARLQRRGGGGRRGGNGRALNRIAQRSQRADDLAELVFPLLADEGRLVAAVGELAGQSGHGLQRMRHGAAIDQQAQGCGDRDGDESGEQQPQFGRGDGRLQCRRRDGVRAAHRPAGDGCHIPEGRISEAAEREHGTREKQLLDEEATLYWNDVHSATTPILRGLT